VFTALTKEIEQLQTISSAYSPVDVETTRREEPSAYNNQSPSSIQAPRKPLELLKPAQMDDAEVSAIVQKAVAQALASARKHWLNDDDDFDVTGGDLNRISKASPNGIDNAYDDKLTRSLAQLQMLQDRVATLEAHSIQDSSAAVMTKNHQILDEKVESLTKNSTNVMNLQEKRIKSLEGQVRRIETSLNEVRGKLDEIIEQMRFSSFPTTRRNQAGTINGLDLNGYVCDNECPY
jgi:predicted RNase H-like nuclease (RuvC/YqgF family)